MATTSTISLVKGGYNEKDWDEIVNEPVLFRPGDHIRLDCQVFDHHAIFVKWVDNDNDQALVVQHTGKHRKGTVEMEEENVREHRLVTRPSRAGDVLYRAMSRIGNGGYHFVFSNCEHFCNWCITGDETINYSTQVLRSLAVGSSNDGRRIGLAATELGWEACRNIFAYMNGTISRDEAIRGVLVAAGSLTVGLAAAAAANKALGGGMLGLVGGFVAGIAGQHVGSNLTQHALNHWGCFGACRAETLRNAYRLLGLGPDATNQEINRAYRNLALKHHPDRPGGSREAFQEIGTAMEVIRATRTDEQEPFPCGTRVLVWNEPATIDIAHGNHTYHVQYDNGQYGEHIDIRYIRPI